MRGEPAKLEFLRGWNELRCGVRLASSSPISAIHISSPVVAKTLRSQHWWGAKDCYTWKSSGDVVSGLEEKMRLMIVFALRERRFFIQSNGHSLFHV